MGKKNYAFTNVWNLWENQGIFWLVSCIQITIWLVSYIHKVDEFTIHLKHIQCLDLMKYLISINQDKENLWGEDSNTMTRLFPPISLKALWIKLAFYGNASSESKKRKSYSS